MKKEIRKTREIIVEFERLQTIRRRAKTLTLNCPICLGEVDFLSLIKAEKLFEIDSDHLISFINETGSHFQNDEMGEIIICLNSLLANMKRIRDASALKHSNK